MKISPRLDLFSLRKLNLLITKIRLTKSKTQWLQLKFTRKSENYEAPKNKESSGHHGISNEDLKCCSPIIEPILAKTFNDIIAFSIYPEWMKLAKITSCIKNFCDGNLPENYRPISLISSLSKVFENFLLKRMMSFCTNHKVLTSDQFWFPPVMCTSYRHSNGNSTAAN